MKPIVPGKFNGASINTGAGELELRLSDGGNWQLKARGEEEFEWRLLCTGNLDGGVFTPPEEDDRAPIRLGPLTIDLAARRVHVGGRATTLTAREFDLLAALAEEPDRVFTRKQLLSALWGYPDAGRSRTLESHASRVRCKLRRIGADGFVVNYRDQGYKLWEGVVAPPDAAPVSLRSV
jgi:DNA-binding response OmpR family regulator